MTLLRANGEVGPDGKLRLEVPTQLPQGKVDVVVVIGSTSNGGKKYDFRDLAGSLQWRGDALVQQRSLRNEW
jgi:hypothetical protein